MFPPLYVILDADLLPDAPEEMADKFAKAGVELFQYRAKVASARQLFDTCRCLVQRSRNGGVRLIVNDRPDVAALCGADGVHVGQEDLPVAWVRRVCGEKAWVGVSTHNFEQFLTAAKTDANYIAVGPVFATATKESPDPIVGVGFIREVRRLTAKPIVAIGGITLENAAEVYDAGADSAAVVKDILTARDPVQRARDFLDLGKKLRAQRN